MMLTKIQDNRPFGSGEEFFIFFYFYYYFFLYIYIYGHGGHYGHVTRTISANFCSPTSKKLHMKFDFDWPSGF